MTSRRGRGTPPGKPAPKPAAEAEGGRQAAALSLAVGALLTRLADELRKLLPEALYRALVQVLLRVPVTVQQLPCATCVISRRAWERAHAPELRAAGEQLAAALAALPEDSPQRDQLSLIEFLPPRLQPSPDPDRPNPDAVANVEGPVTMIGGTLYCAEHAPDQIPDPGRRPLLVAHGTLPPGGVAG